MQKRAKSSINFRPILTWVKTTRHDIVGSDKARKRTRVNPSSCITYSGQNHTWVVTKTLRFINIENSWKNVCVISKQFNRRIIRQVIDINKEEQWAKNGSLRHTSIDILRRWILGIKGVVRWKNRFFKN